MSEIVFTEIAEDAHYQLARANIESIESELSSLMEKNKGDITAEIKNTMEKFNDSVFTEKGKELFKFDQKTKKILFNEKAIDFKKFEKFPDNTITMRSLFKFILGEEVLPADAEKLATKLDKARIESPEMKKVMSAQDSAKVSPGKGPADLTAKEGKTSMEKIAKKAKDGVVKAGKWVTSTIKLFLIIGTIEQIRGVIQEHQKAMNGCWLLNTKTGGKRKINALTCNDGAKNSQEEGLNDAWTAKDNVELKKVEQYIENCKVNNDADGCKHQLDKLCDDKNGDWCSKYCTIESIECSSEYTVTCVASTFFGALEDLTGQIIDDGSSILSKATNILKIILYGILIVIAIFIIFKLIMYIIKLQKNKNNKKT